MQKATKKYNILNQTKNKTPTTTTTTKQNKNKRSPVHIKYTKKQ